MRRLWPGKDSRVCWWAKPGAGLGRCLRFGLPVICPGRGGVECFWLLFAAMPQEIIILIVVWLLPLGAAAGLQVLPRAAHRWAFVPVVAVELVAVAAMLWLRMSGAGAQELRFDVPWFALGGQSVVWSVVPDRVSLTVLTALHVVALLVGVFSVAYMRGDAGFRRYYSLLGFFVFAMHGLLLSSNLLMIYICWELVGFASYLLIGFWREQPAANRAAKKAFMVNRVGDAGLMLALMAIYQGAGTLDLAGLAAAEAEGNWVWWAGIGLVLAAMAKSAQLPLSIWLPDAMTGPTPVSALIHAATMVAAGVYLLVRTAFFFPPELLIFLAWLGGLTALAAGLTALFQFDLKKILAYSTISQLGYMVSAVGLGSGEAALFHLETHAFFKAGLFLGAGALIHLLHERSRLAAHHPDAQDIRLMGGMYREAPWVFGAFALCAAALMGLPFTSGFLSKEPILMLAWEHGQLGPFALLMVSVLLTGWYTVRLMVYVFGGKVREAAFATGVGSEPLTRWPIVVLGLGSLWWVFEVWPIDPHTFESASHLGLTLGAQLLVIVGGGLALRLARPAAESITEAAGREWLGSFFGLHRLYLVCGQGLALLGKGLALGDRRLLDGLINGLGRFTAALAFLLHSLDRLVVDGAIRLLAWLTRTVGLAVRQMHSGRVSLFYLVVLAVFGFLLWVVL